MTTALLSEDVSASGVQEPALVIDGTVPDLGRSLQELEDLSDRIRLEIREELRDELRSELRQEFENAAEGSRGYRPMRALLRGIGEVGGTLVAFLLSNTFSSPSAGGVGGSCCSCGEKAPAPQRQHNIKRVTTMRDPPTLADAISLQRSSTYMPVQYSTAMSTESNPKWNRRLLVR